MALKITKVVKPDPALTKALDTLQGYQPKVTWDHTEGAVAVVELEAVPAVVKVESVPEMTETEALTQEYIVLYRQFVEHDVKNIVKRMDDIRKVLVATANAVSDGPHLFTCVDGEIEFAERSKVLEVPSPLELVDFLMAKFGQEATESVMDIAITPLRKILNEKELKEVTKEVPGSRTLKAVRPL